VKPRKPLARILRSPYLSPFLQGRRLGTGRVVSKIAGHCSPGTRAIAGEMMHRWLFDHPDGPVADHLTAWELLAVLRQLQERRLAP
jgi:hypothetical protein